MVGFIDPVGTIFQSAIADLKEVATSNAIKSEYPHPLQNIVNFVFQVFFTLFSSNKMADKYFRFAGFLPERTE